MQTLGAKTFRVSKQKLNATAPLAANQGVYNLLVGIACIFSSLPWSSMFPGDGDDDLFVVRKRRRSLLITPKMEAAAKAKAAAAAAVAEAAAVTAEAVESA